MPQSTLEKLIRREDLTRDEARRLADALMDGEVAPALMAALLVALRMKGETPDEVTGFAQAMRSRVLPVCSSRAPLLDTCGTGGSAFRVFNVSTAAAFVAAAGGIGVAKHGNRRATGTCGSADVLEAAGLSVSLSPEQVAACIDAVGIGFLFAPAHHTAMRHIGPTRRDIGVRTLFNLLGPLTNPAGAAFQVMGVYDPALCVLACHALRELGSRRALVAHGDIGLDEISTLGPTQISELRDGDIRRYTLTPADLGVTGPPPDPAWLAPAATLESNVTRLRDVLAGHADTPADRARRDLVAVNAAASLRVFGLAESWPDAVEMAREILASGAALAVLDRLIAFAKTV